MKIDDMERYQIFEDGPGRFVLVDNESDDPSPVFRTREEAKVSIRKCKSPTAPVIDRMANDLVRAFNEWTPPTK